MSSDQLYSRWLHAKTPVHARNGLMTARHPLAAEAGVDVLRRGGNALDARFPDDTAAALERRGHRVQRAEEDLYTLHFANPSIGLLAEDGTLHAGVNPLHLTAAAGW